MLTCDQALERISAQLDNELTDREEALLEEHLQGCAACRALQTDFQALHTALQESAAAWTAEPPAALAQDVMAAVRAAKVTPFQSKRQAWRRRSWACAAAMLALVLLGGGVRLWLNGPWPAAGVCGQRGGAVRSGRGVRGGRAPGGRPGNGGGIPRRIGGHGYADDLRLQRRPRAASAGGQRKRFPGERRQGRGRRLLRIRRGRLFPSRTGERTSRNAVLLRRADSARRQRGGSVRLSLLPSGRRRLLFGTRGCLYRPDRGMGRRRRAHGRRRHCPRRRYRPCDPAHLCTLSRSAPRPGRGAAFCFSQFFAVTPFQVVYNG